jgi:hypothetical protein
MKSRCDVCGVSFSRKYELERHRATSHGLARLRCKTCSKCFTRRDNLQRHEKICHAGSSRDFWKPKRQTGGALEPEPPQLEDKELQKVYTEYWSAIRSYRHDQGDVQQVHNRRLTSADTKDVESELWKIFGVQKHAFKINFSYGLILRHNDTGELRYFHACQNNARLLDMPWLVRNEDDFKNLLEKIRQYDILEYARQQRPDTKWMVYIVSNMSVYINAVADHPIGSPVILPDYIRKNKAILGLITENRSQKPYDDKLCLFRCIALALGYTERNFKKMVDRLVSQYPKGKDGVTLGELSKLEKLFKVQINVWKLDEDGTTELVQRSASNHDIICNVNLYQDHFSYITNLGKYCKSYHCSTCDKLWKDAGMYHRHQATCSIGIKHQYSGGTYQTPLTIWEELDEAGIKVEDRFFPYRATFDIETYFTKENLPRNTDKVDWVAQHNLLSISVASNVPDYEEPVCFVTDGDSQTVVDDFISHLEAISETSYNILCEHYEGVPGGYQ